MSDYLPTIENAHPNAKLLMDEDFFYKPIDETAPFGNDDGADAYAGFRNWRVSHQMDKPKLYLSIQLDQWDYPRFDLNETDFDKLKTYLKENDLGSRFMSGTDAAIFAIAFGQLYLEGTVDSEFKEIAKTSIRRQLNPGLLNLWPEQYKSERETKLKKMLAILDRVN